MLPAGLSDKIADLYRRMEEAYDLVADALAFSCAGCPDNCCDSYFLHHTSIEWLYLWEGLQELAPEQLARVEARAGEYVRECEAALARGERPRVNCPLLGDDGLCTLYRHRLMICRMHGVPSRIVFPNGREQQFPGCFRCQEQTANRHDLPRVDRTPLLRELAALEQELLTTTHPLPKTKKTIAEMIVQGPPKLD